MKELPMFTQEELAYVANRWYFWKGLFIGASIMLIGLTGLGLYINY